MKCRVRATSLDLGLHGVDLVLALEQLLLELGGVEGEHLLPSLHLRPLRGDAGYFELPGMTELRWAECALARAPPAWYSPAMACSRRGWIGFLALAWGCGSPPPPPAPSSAPDVLRVGTSGDYAPFSTLEGDERVGFDIDVARELSRDLGMRVQWVAFAWPELSAAVAAGAFDIAMSGVTWRPPRAVLGYMTQAVASGGPCLLGDPAAARVAVNRGGMLEAWSREHLPGREVLAVDDNLSLPDLLESGTVGAIVTDSFELSSFRRPGFSERCELPHSRKVYWVAPERADLGPRVDEWLLGHEPRLRELRDRWFGDPAGVDASARLVDVLARRMALMPFVAAYKRAHGLPIEDLERERVVLEAAVRRARVAGLDAAGVRELFALLIDLAKAVQARSSQEEALDLEGALRPLLLRLGEQVVAALRRARAAGGLAEMSPARLELLSAWLTEPERARLVRALKALSPS